MTEKETEAKQALSDSEVKTENQEKKKPVGVPERKKFADGGYKEFVFTGPIRDAEEFKETCRNMGYDPLDGEVASYQNEMAEITKRVYEWTQSDDPVENARFIRQQLRRIPSGGNRILNLLRQLQLLAEQEKEQ